MSAHAPLRVFRPARSLRAPLAVGLLASTAVWACGSDSNQNAGTSQGATGNDGAGGSHDSNGAGVGASSGGLSGVEDGGVNVDVGPEPSGNSWAEQGCAEHDARTELSPVYLAFLLDFSASMFVTITAPQQNIRHLRWDPVTEALDAFFGDDESAGLHASLTLFPLLAGNDAARCVATNYETPDVPMTALPNGDPFTAAFTNATAQASTGITMTPTLPALTGTLEFVRAHREASPDGSVAIVMVTDGVPQSCTGNTVEASAAVAAEAAAENIPTYVIGVGDALESLAAIAEAGGTEEATLIDVGNPEATRQALLDKFLDIRGSQISCDLPLPQPPAGKSLDPDRVNVEVTLGGDTLALDRDVNCTDGEGWRYDDPASPTHIELCSQTCELVTASDDAEVNVVFGCVTVVK